MMVTITLDNNVLSRDYRPRISKVLHAALFKQGGDQFVQQHFGPSSAKLFSYSVYLPTSRFGPEIIMESNYIKVIFSAYDENVFDDFFLSMMGMQNQTIDMGENVFSVSSVVRIIEKTVLAPCVNIHMLSPLVVRQGPVSRQEGRNCLGVKDPGFDTYLRESVSGMLAPANLDKELLSTLSIEPLGDTPCKEAHVLHKGRFYRSTLGDLQLSGDPALLNLLYNAGMGEMREEGFGLFELGS
jgi:CRISPR-associated endoribonuclease Cas6